MAELESPASADELYLYRGDEVPRTRPMFQGDVFDDIEIPGFEDGPGLAMVITHGCTMRQGPALRDRLVVARVFPSPAIALPWKGNFRTMPLPALIPDAAQGHWALNFEDLGAVPSKDLDLTKRVACLDDRGVVLL